MANLNNLFPGGFKLHEQISIATHQPADIAFSEILERWGARLTGQIHPDGKIHRIDCAGDKQGSKNGWYILFDDGVASGAYGSWKTGEKHSWCAVADNQLSIHERDEHRHRMEVARQIRDEEQRQRWHESANNAAHQANNAIQASTDHPYLVTKNISAHGVLQYGDNLIIPIINIDGHIQSLQTISSDGEKKFLYGGKIAGGMFVIGTIRDHVYLVEGFSTGATVPATMGVESAVVVAFNAGNLPAVAAALIEKHPMLLITILADNDAWTDGNPGVTKAREAAAENLGRCGVIIPHFEDTSTRPTDFNDLMRLEGPDVVREMISKGPAAPLYQSKPDEINSVQPPDIINPPGILKDFIDYYARTSRCYTPVFAIQAGLALGSIVIARRYRTTKSNFSSLYFLLIGKSGAGKEHAKDIISRIMHESGIGDCYKGNGYTSPGAVFSQLQETPAHISIIDEFGRGLQSNKKSGNSQQEEVITTLMEAFGSLHGIMDPPTYSTMGLTVQQKSKVKRQPIYNPAISILALSQPKTFFNAISGDNISDGFLGRFLFVENDDPRQPGDEPEYEEVPQSIINWIHEIQRVDEIGNLTAIVNDISTLQTSNPKIMTFTSDALAMIKDFYKEICDRQNELDDSGLAELLGRTKEKAMRLSMIIALARNPNTRDITAEDIIWSINYSRWCDFNFIIKSKRLMSDSDIEGKKKEFLFAIRDRGEKGVTVGEMIKQQPFSKVSRREKTDILHELLEAGLIQVQNKRSGKKGRPTNIYVAINPASVGL